MPPTSDRLGVRDDVIRRYSTNGILASFMHFFLRSHPFLLFSRCNSAVFTLLVYVIPSCIVSFETMPLLFFVFFYSDDRWERNNDE